MKPNPLASLNHLTVPCSIDRYTSFFVDVYVEPDRKLLQGRNCVSGENLLKRPCRIERKPIIACDSHAASATHRGSIHVKSSTAPPTVEQRSQCSCRLRSKNPAPESSRSPSKQYRLNLVFSSDQERTHRCFRLHAVSPAGPPADAGLWSPAL